MSMDDLRYHVEFIWRCGCWCRRAETFASVEDAVADCIDGGLYRIVASDGGGSIVTEFCIEKPSHPPRLMAAAKGASP
jgi:hypothetical protein